MTDLDTPPVCSRFVDAISGNYGDFLSVGYCVSELIFGAAEWLRHDNAPGLVSLVLVIILVASVIHLWAREKSSIGSLKSLKGSLEVVEGESPFIKKAGKVTQEMNERRERNDSDYVATAWCEFHETLILDESTEPPVYRNSVRPSIFFNIDDLHFGPGIYRFAPGLFVSVGLLLTFLGLISALIAIEDGLSVDSTPDDRLIALTNLLRAASAKFVMSLAGLFASIVFTILLRRSMARVDQEIQLFCSTMEKQLSFISLEDKAVEHITLTRSHKEDFQRLGNDLVDKFGEVLEEKLSGQISASVGDALSKASKEFMNAAEKIGTMSEGMSKTSQNMQGQMDKAVGSLIDATKELTKELRGAASDMVEAAKEFKKHMDAAVVHGSSTVQEGFHIIGTTVKGQGREIATEFDRLFKNSSGIILEAVGEFKNKLRDELILPIRNVVDQFREMEKGLRDGVAQIGIAADHIEAGGRESRSGAESISAASRDLLEAVGPIRKSVERLMASVEELSQSTKTASDTVSRSSEEVAKRSSEVLASVGSALSAERQSLEATMMNLEEIIRKMAGYWEQTNKLDENLGRAFEHFTGQIEKTAGALSEHARKMNEELAPALTKMREIVEEIEMFRLERQRERS